MRDIIGCRYHPLSQFTENTRITFLPSANEVCEGYLFTRVCHSVHGGVSRPYPGGRLRGLAGGVSRPIPREEVGGSGQGGSPGPGPGVYPSMHRGRPQPPEGYCCGRYASYWNAFLFHSGIETPFVSVDHLLAYHKWRSFTMAFTFSNCPHSWRPFQICVVHF